MRPFHQANDRTNQFSDFQHNLLMFTINFRTGDESFRLLRPSVCACPGRTTDDSALTKIASRHFLYLEVEKKTHFFCRLVINLTHTMRSLSTTKWQSHIEYVLSALVRVSCVCVSRRAFKIQLDGTIRMKYVAMRWVAYANETKHREHRKKKIFYFLFTHKYKRTHTHAYIANFDSNNKTKHTKQSIPFRRVDCRRKFIYTRR